MPDESPIGSSEEEKLATSKTSGNSMGTSNCVVAREIYNPLDSQQYERKTTQILKGSLGKLHVKRNVRIKINIWVRSKDVIPLKNNRKGIDHA